MYLQTIPFVSFLLYACRMISKDEVKCQLVLVTLKNKINKKRTQNLKKLQLRLIHFVIKVDIWCYLST